MTWTEIGAILASEVIIAGAIVRIFAPNGKLQDLRERITRLESMSNQFEKDVIEIKDILKGLNKNILEILSNR